MSTPGPLKYQRSHRSIWSEGAQLHQVELCCSTTGVGVQENTPNSTERNRERERETEALVLHSSIRPVKRRVGHRPEGPEPPLMPGRGRERERDREALSIGMCESSVYSGLRMFHCRLGPGPTDIKASFEHLSGVVPVSSWHEEETCKAALYICMLNSSMTEYGVRRRQDGLDSGTSGLLPWGSAAVVYSG